MYTPVSYNNYELELKDNEFIVKDENNHWGKLKCSRNILNDDLDNMIDSEICTYTLDSSKCLANIDKRDFTKVKKYCQFMEKEPTPALMTEEGLLVQSSQISLREIDKDKRIYPISNKHVPYLINSEKVLSVVNKDIENLYEPISNSVTKKIIQTFLDEIQVKSLTTLQTLKNWNWEQTNENVIYISGISISIFFSLSCLMLCMCKRNNLQNFFVRRQMAQTESQRRQQNYRMNRTILGN